VDRAKFTVKETHLGGSSAQYVTQQEDLEGKIFKKDLSGGTILTVQHVEERVLVNRGELVSIVVENGNLVARTKGKALEKGKIGDSIRVRNVSSGREVVGLVTGNGTVAVKL
jgi:flagellar basal body P-ring formation protein FlgA